MFEFWGGRLIGVVIGCGWLVTVLNYVYILPKAWAFVPEKVGCSWRFRRNGQDLDRSRSFRQGPRSLTTTMKRTFNATVSGG